MEIKPLTVTFTEEQTRLIIGVSALDEKDPATWVRDSVEVCLEGALDGSCWRPAPDPAPLDKATA